MRSTSDKQKIGRLEKIDLPELDIFGLDAKIDTGAYTSSLHCHHIETEVRDGVMWVSFNVLDPTHPEYEENPYRAKVHRKKLVRSSNGMTEERVIIKQKTNFAGRKGVIQLSLTDRSEMKYPVLIGRRFLSGKYLVDVSETYLS
ncbi:MAG: ATP-dependent zinc protease [Balneolaceae bacterium]|nr:ATP-dependent zinc protease [Balneolaceae bacterium]MCH8547373.1 RimK/LysX family protein [Balneolaceae bacterium]